MARYRRSPGWCAYCERRVWVTRYNQFFTKWRCERCGSREVAVGATDIRYAESLYRQDMAVAAAIADPSAQIGGYSVDDLTEDEREPVGLINRAFGWMIRD